MFRQEIPDCRFSFIVKSRVSKAGVSRLRSSVAQQQGTLGARRKNVLVSKKEVNKP